MTEWSPGFSNVRTVAGAVKITGSRKDEGSHILKNSSGLKAAVKICGGKLINLIVPDVKGKPTDIIDSPPVDFQQTGLNLFWETSFINQHTLELTCFSNAGDDRFAGYPVAKVLYALTNDNRLKITYEAAPEQVKALSLSNKLFFNLNGAGNGGVLNHLVQINADNYVPLDDNAVPAERIEAVSGTPFDFRKATTIGARINDNNEQLKNGKGYNHIFALNKHSSRTPVAKIKGDKSGIIMELCTDEQGVDFYSCNLMQNSSAEKGDCRNVFSLGPTRFGGSLKQLPNVQPGDDQIYKYTTVYQFKTGNNG